MMAIIDLKTLKMDELMESNDVLDNVTQILQVGSDIKVFDENKRVHVTKYTD